MPPPIGMRTELSTRPLGPSGSCAGTVFVLAEVTGIEPAIPALTVRRVRVRPRSAYFGSFSRAWYQNGSKTGRLPTSTVVHYAQHRVGRGDLLGFVEASGPPWEAKYIAENHGVAGSIPALGITET